VIALSVSCPKDRVLIPSDPKFEGGKGIALLPYSHWRHNGEMGRTPQRTAPDLFSTAAAGDTSPSRPKPTATDATAEPAPQRHVLPKDLRNAVKHLSDRELDSLHAATLEEMKRRGRLAPSLAGPPALQRKRSRSTGKIAHSLQPDLSKVHLTRGQVKAVRSAFKAGITPAKIAREFGLSQSDVRKALATDDPKR
jgi:hypothetical protein